VEEDLEPAPDRHPTRLGQNSAARALACAPEAAPDGTLIATWEIMKTHPPVQPEALPNTQALRALVTPRPGPLVTLYLPLLRTFVEARANAAAWEGAVADAEAQLEDAGLSAAEAQGIRKQLAAVETDLRRLGRPAAGLAVFHDRTALHVYALAREPRRSVTVAENFALRPLLEAVHHNQRHCVLALSANRVALFEADAFGLEAISAQGVPASLEDALGSELTENELRVRGTQAGAGAPVFYSHDSGRDERKLDLERFHQKLARAIETVLAGREGPIVLVATQAHHSGLRAALRTPRLLAEGVQTSPDHLSPSELHARCWPLVERAVDAEDARIAGDYERAVNHGKGLHRIDDVAAAAVAGRVRRLWVKPGERMPGAVDLASGALAGGRTREDVLDGLVTLVLRHGGDVFVSERIPSGTAVAAELH
jgi:hypothetical protein